MAEWAFEADTAAPAPSRAGTWEVRQPCVAGEPENALVTFTRILLLPPVERRLADPQAADHLLHRRARLRLPQTNVICSSVKRFFFMANSSLKRASLPEKSQSGWNKIRGADQPKQLLNREIPRQGEVPSLGMTSGGVGHCWFRNLRNLWI